MIVNSYREIFNATTDMFGQFMRLVEVACIPIYIYQILFSIELLCIATIRLETLNPNNSFIVGDPSIKFKKKCSLAEFDTFSGKAMEWLILEVFVFGFFLATMLLTLCKSRCMSVGMDNSTQFEETQMSFMVNKIIKNIDIYSIENPEEYYINKERMVTFQGVVIKVCLPPEYYADIKARKEVKPYDAI